jgi:hypothetical protein
MFIEIHNFVIVVEEENVFSYSGTFEDDSFFPIMHNTSTFQHPYSFHIFKLPTTFENFEVIWTPIHFLYIFEKLACWALITECCCPQNFTNMKATFSSHTTKQTWKFFLTTCITHISISEGKSMSLKSNEETLSKNFHFLRKNRPFQKHMSRKNSVRSNSWNRYCFDIPCWRWYFFLFS